MTISFGDLPDLAAEGTCKSALKGTSPLLARFR